MNSLFPKVIKITTFQDFPYSGYEEINGTLKGKGYAFQLLESLQSYYKFDYRIILPPINKFSSELEAMLSQLSTKEVEMAVAFVPIETQLKSEVCEKCVFSTTLDTTEITVMMKRPEVSASGSGVLAPFDLTVWMLVLVSLILVGPVMYFIIYLRSKFLNFKCENYSLYSCIWFVYGALLKQGSTMKPVSDPTRILFVTWWIFVIILTAFYTANLTAFLTLSHFTLPIKNTQDLLEQKFKWFIIANSLTEFIIKYNYANTDLLNIGLTSGAGKTIDNIDNFNNSDITKWIDNKDVFVTEKIFGKMLLYEKYKENLHKYSKENQRCEYVIMPGNLLNVQRGFVFYNGTLIYEPFVQRLAKIVENGLTKQLKTTDLPLATICPLDLGDSERKLRITDLLITYEIVLGGIISGIIIFLGELLYRHYKKSPGKYKNFRILKKKKKGNRKIEKVEVKHIAVTPPPQYLFLDKQIKFKRAIINGREYYVIIGKNNEKSLVPVRTLSAFLFR